MKDKLVTKGNLERAVNWIDTALQAVQKAKQDRLVSGTNIKTVNGQSLLGSGNIAISMANLFELNLPDSIYIKSEVDVQQYLNDNFSSPLVNLYQYVSLKPLRFVCDSYQWGELQSDGHYYAEVPVRVLFPDNSELTKTILFSRSEYALGVKLSATFGRIDTGLSLDYSYEFEARGYTLNGQAVLVDAFIDTSRRTTLRILGKSNKIQFMWPNLNEITYSDTGIDFTKPFTYIQKSNSLILKQDSITYTANIDNSSSSGMDSAGIYLLNSADNSNFGNGVLYYAIIRDSNGNVLRHFKPQYIENNELVLVDVANDNTVYRPNRGCTLLPVE